MSSETSASAMKSRDLGVKAVQGRNYDPELPGSLGQSPPGRGLVFIHMRLPAPPPASRRAPMLRLFHMPSLPGTPPE